MNDLDMFIYNISNSIEFLKEHKFKFYQVFNKGMTYICIKQLEYIKRTAELMRKDVTDEVIKKQKDILDKYRKLV